MNDFQPGHPGSWSSDPNAPQISYPFYRAEKFSFIGTFIASSFYGTDPETFVVFYLVRSIYHSRNRHPSLHPMYDLFIRPDRKALQVDTYGPHFRHVLVCDHIQRIRLQRPILLLHRSPPISFPQLHHHLWTPIRFHRHVRPERLAGRRTFGKPPHPIHSLAT